MKRVAILGCGPAGLVAAHAAVLQGWDPTIFSKKRKSFLFGSQYLHEPIPGISDPTAFVNVHYTTNGSPVEYRRKVHGDAWDGIVDPEDFQEHHQAWNIRQAYDELWLAYWTKIVHVEIFDSPNGEANFERTNTGLRLWEYDLVISSLPRKIWAMPGDQFISSDGWALGDAPEQGVFVPYRTPADNMIICDGTKDVAWTRLSCVFGYTSVEWPNHKKPPIEGVSKVVKPLRFISGPMDNGSDEWVHIGRYGKWQKGELVTDAFNDAMKEMAE